MADGEPGGEGADQATPAEMQTPADLESNQDARIIDYARKAEELNLPQLAAFLYGKGKSESSRDYVNSSKTPQELGELAAGVILIAGARDGFAEIPVTGDKYEGLTTKIGSTKPEVQAVLDKFDIAKIRKGEISIRAKKADVSGPEKTTLQALAAVAGAPVRVDQERITKGTRINPDSTIRYSEGGIVFDERFFKAQSK